MSRWLVTLVGAALVATGCTAKDFDLGGGDGAPATATPSPVRSPTPTAATPSPTPPVRTPTPPPPQPLERGDSGPDVSALQERLRDLGYWIGAIDENFGVLTEQAVYAFQEYERMEVTGIFDARTASRLAEAARPVPRSTTGDLVEVDKARQILFVVRDGAALWTFNTSTGTGEPYRHPDGHRALADTPDGRWTIDWQVNGRREGDLGPLWRPKYFHSDGLAIHGYGSVPPEAVSHGCVRLRFDAMNFLWREDLAPVGSTVWVY